MEKSLADQPNTLARSRPRLVAEQDIDHRLSAAGLIYLKNFMAQRAVYFSKRSPESVHQMRVAIRRLRTVIAVALFITADESLIPCNSILRNFARVLGRGRDQDIFIGMLQQIPSSFFYDLDAQEIAVYNIISAREKFYLQIDAALQSSETNALFDQLIKYFQLRECRVHASFTESANLDALVLDRFLKAVIKRGRKLSEQDLTQRHQLRISLKKLRYALEFLALDRSRNAYGQAYRKRLERLLAQLGAANDAFTASRIAKDSLAQNNGQINLMAGMITGWHGRAVQDNEETLIKSWKKFKLQPSFWDT